MFQRSAREGKLDRKLQVERASERGRAVRKDNYQGGDFRFVLLFKVDDFPVCRSKLAGEGGRAENQEISKTKVTTR